MPVKGSFLTKRLETDAIEKLSTFIMEVMLGDTQATECMGLNIPAICVVVKERILS